MTKINDFVTATLVQRVLDTLEQGQNVGQIRGMWNVDTKRIETRLKGG